MEKYVEYRGVEVLFGTGLSLVCIIQGRRVSIPTLLIQPGSDPLRNGDRVELRGFGAFSVKSRESRLGRNPRTGDAVKVEAKRVPVFRAGKEVRERLNSPQ